MAQNTPIVGIGDSFSYGTGSPVTYTAVNGVTSIARSGDSAWRDPSRWLWKVTPSSFSVRIFDSDMT